ncbi:hypothetical protein [Kitasatospora sp. A2-31]|uniref:hypothetical protein n=1 Tax=Kitasatospora sp. A2-31 TaxID=2916414 RepID=UPI001EEB43E1|nr:hypothetical protein [Kitasatospora sp. A2-31]MCG6496448.1 hypothetical protein [Kitasatospora sp. A2-31]
MAVAEGVALNALSAGGVDAFGVGDRSPDGAADGAADATADGDGLAPALAGGAPWTAGAGAAGAAAEGVAGAVGMCTTVGQAVRLAGAPASTGTAVGRIPQPVASASSSTAPAAGRSSGRGDVAALTAHPPR